jgi:hypothetical protein
MITCDNNNISRARTRSDFVVGAKPAAGYNIHHVRSGRRRMWYKDTGGGIRDKVLESMISRRRRGCDVRDGQGQG